MNSTQEKLLVLLAVLTAATCSLPATAEPPPAFSGAALARAAARQVGVTTLYDPSYRRLDYPGGDVPLERGVCTDVVIRAFRAIGLDLQVEIHKDMTQRRDANIDHRRVVNQMAFFQRRGKSLARSAAYEPGDVVAWRLANGLHHIGIVAEARSARGHYLVVHNIGQGTRVEDVLYAFEKLGHYRW